MEQQVINAFMKLTAKAGGGEFIKDLVQKTDENGNPKIWNASELEHAYAFLNRLINTFGKPDALQVIYTLMKKYDLRLEDLHMPETLHEPLPPTSGVQGLQ